MLRISTLVLVCCCWAAVYGQYPEEWVARRDAGMMVLATTLPDDMKYVADVGNGYLATRIFSDTIYVSGLFNGQSTKGPSHRARIPSSVAIDIVNCRSSSVVYALDVERAVFYKRCTSITGAASGVTVEQRWFAPRHLRHLLVHEIEVSNTGAADVRLLLNLNNGTASTDITFTPYSGVSGDEDSVAITGGITTPEDPDEPRQLTVAMVYSKIPDFIDVPAHTLTPRTYTYLTCIHTSLDTSAGTSQMAQQTIAEYQTALVSPNKLLPAHIQDWASIWDSGIEIGGNTQLAAVVNTSLYWILGSLREDWPFGLSPGSLSSNSYNGHCFWDTETWMYPNTLLLYPPLAKSLLQYRVDRVHGAQKKAASYTPPFKGAMYPWESALSGVECTPTWAATGLREIHIAGDISFAAQQYWYLTQDKQWLSEMLPMLTEIADFWVSKVIFDNITNQYWITDVIPPDEYADHTSNSAYTNFVATVSLEFASLAAKLLSQPTNPQYHDIASKMYMPFDPKLQIHPEYDNYNGQKIKQADVVLLGYPMMMPMSPVTRQNDLEYYEARTDYNGPAMTHGMHAVGWLELGSPANASQAFTRSYANNVKQPFLVWSESPKGGAVNFITGAGGFLQGVWAGYGGIRIVGDAKITVTPQLPDNTNLLRVRGVRMVGAVLDISVNDKAVIDINLRKMSSPQQLCVTISGSTNVPLVVGKPVTFNQKQTPTLTIQLC